MGEKRLSLEELKNLKVYTPSRASEYLRRVRGMIIQPDSLRAVKRRKHNASAAEMQLGNMTLWTRDELDVIEVTSWTKTVEPEREEVSEEDCTSGGSSMILRNNEMFYKTSSSLAAVV